MPRRARFAPLIALLLSAGCGSRSTAADLPTLEAMRPRLTRELTPSLAEQAFGPPDQVTGSGALVYVYRLERSHRVYLGFPGYAPIVYAKLRTPEGRFEDLPLAP